MSEARFVQDRQIVLQRSQIKARQHAASVKASNRTWSLYGHCRAHRFGCAVAVLKADVGGAEVLAAFVECLENKSFKTSDVVRRTVLARLWHFVALRVSNPLLANHEHRVLLGFPGCTVCVWVDELCAPVGSCPGTARQAHSPTSTSCCRRLSPRSTLNRSGRFSIAASMAVATLSTFAFDVLACIGSMCAATDASVTRVRA
ncbi:uncharacterized protein UMAG_04135 [Mycosarcoma maydis]|uniref:Uncharacterized protein n=1 Tax=Mycosarcoma maydis TaxID=5270 RepID=A0A0D1C1B1_MYCMD|nr:uncharacterized protein UMAG_04135 [Ustilago maydis 521]KIS67632.1 hypothetical protein UMAG_04135 [Ustilago maydis 521]|eukprot:XP_011390632.1 hypothetical protein UMAG_04135 [Ustilago maydis 521]